MFQRLWLSSLRIALAVGAFFFLLWCFGMRMPGKNISRPAPLSGAEIGLRAELVDDVRKLALEIGERNMPRYPQLNAAADFIEGSFSRAGLRPRRDTYELSGRACHNIEAEIRGVRPQVVIIGAHYDSVVGCPHFSLLSPWYIWRPRQDSNL